MKFLTALVLTILLSYTIGLFTVLPWYSFAIGTLFIAIGIHQKPFKSFGAGFIGVFLVWVVLAFLQDNANEHLLSTKVANILPLKGSYILLTIITGILGGLVGGLSALTGSYIRK